MNKQKLKQIIVEVIEESKSNNLKSIILDLVLDSKELEELIVSEDYTEDNIIDLSSDIIKSELDTNSELCSKIIQYGKSNNYDNLDAFDSSEEKELAFEIYENFEDLFEVTKYNDYEDGIEYIKNNNN